MSFSLNMIQNLLCNASMHAHLHLFFKLFNFHFSQTASSTPVVHMEVQEQKHKLSTSQCKDCLPSLITTAQQIPSQNTLANKPFRLLPKDLQQSLAHRATLVFFRSMHTYGEGNYEVATYPNGSHSVL